MARYELTEFEWKIIQAPEAYNLDGIIMQIKDSAKAR